MLKIILGAALVAGLGVGRQAQAQVYSPQQVSGAIGKSVPLMLKSDTQFRTTMSKVCFSCHHQIVPSVAYSLALQHGFRVNAAAAQGGSNFVYSFLAKTKPLLDGVKQGDAKAELQVDRILVDPTISMAYVLYGQAEGGRKRDETLSEAAFYLAKKQSEDGRWPVFAARPPMEGSEFTCTALAVRSLRAYSADDQAEEVNRRIARARTWLLAGTPRNTEDKAFRLLGLKWSGADPEAIRKATADLLADQRDDGGWGQLSGKGSDAYATGQALVALNQGGGVAALDAAYQRGVVYLLISQQPDGSWNVPKRAIGIQHFFETQFPHGKSQFISIAGTAWATSALALTAEPPARTASR